METWHLDGDFMGLWWWFHVDGIERRFSGIQWAWMGFQWHSNGFFMVIQWCVMGNSWDWICFSWDLMAFWGEYNGIYTIHNLTLRCVSYDTNFGLAEAYLVKKNHMFHILFSDTSGWPTMKFPAVPCTPICSCCRPTNRKNHSHPFTTIGT